MPDSLISCLELYPKKLSRERIILRVLGALEHSVRSEILAEILNS